MGVLGDLKGSSSDGDWPESLRFRVLYLYMLDSIHWDTIRESCRGGPDGEKWSPYLTSADAGGDLEKVPPFDVTGWGDR